MSAPASKAVAFAGSGLVRAKIGTAQLTAVNDVLDRMRRGDIVGRMVLKIGG
jgi:D-arabinose 1-dehydrogenase-like Zn-dependent alcohol dehydrogenase